MATRAIWSGSLSFGLINIPVRLYSAAEERGLDLDMLDKETHQPIGYARVIRGTDQVVKWESIVRGFKYHDGDYVVLTDEDFKKASPAKSRTIEIAQFVDQSEIDSKFYEKPYYLEPDAKSTKAYALLREALAKSGRVAIATYVMREKEHLAAVKAEGEVLVLNHLRYAQDIRGVRGLDIPGKEEVKPRELEMALSLIEQLTEPFKPEQYKDTYTDDLMALIEAKAKGKTPKARPAGKEEPTEDVDDLLTILRASLKAGGATRARAKTKAEDKPYSARPAAARKSEAEPAPRSRSRPARKTAASTGRSSHRK